MLAKYYRSCAVAAAVMHHVLVAELAPMAPGWLSAWLAGRHETEQANMIQEEYVHNAIWLGLLVIVVIIVISVLLLLLLFACRRYGESRILQSWCLLR